MLGEPPAVEFARRYDWEAINEYYESGHSMTECMALFGFSRHAWWDAIRRGAITPRPRAEAIETVLSRGRRRNRQHVKSRLIAAGLKQLRCERCGLSEWRGKPLSLELHHVNGDGLDNTLENLLLLCPNCHSQTDTWEAGTVAARQPDSPRVPVGSRTAMYAPLRLLARGSSTSGSTRTVAPRRRSPNRLGRPPPGTRSQRTARSSGSCTRP